MRKGIALISNLFFSSLLLNGCTSMSIAVTGAQAVYDRHSLSQKWQNYSIAYQINNDLKQYPVFNKTRVLASSFNYDVLLVGQVPTAQLKQQATHIAKQLEDICHVYNGITVGPGISTKRQVEDSWITTKIKSKFIASNDITPDNFKVITENGIVFLMGHVHPAEAKAAIQLARETEGVEKVVTIMHYLQLTTSMKK